MEDTANTELIRSHVDTIILKTLHSKDSYPYEILREIEDLSSSKYVLKQATLYSCMKRLEKLGYINSYWGTESEGGRRRYYSLTENGKEFLNRDTEEWEFSRTLMNKLLSDKEVDLDTITPPFDASSLRPLTKRGQSKVNDTEPENTPTQASASEPPTPLENASEQVANVSPPTFEKSAIVEKSDTFARFDPSGFDKIVKQPIFNTEKNVEAENSTVYFTKDPVFQKNLAEIDQNTTVPSSQWKIETFFEESNFQDTEEDANSRNAAADLLHIGKRFNDLDAEIPLEEIPQPTFVAKQSKTERTENYRDVLNKIFDTEIERIDIRAEKLERQDAQTMASEPLRGKHIKDLQVSLEKQGYTLKVYSPKNRSDYYYNRYIYKNKMTFVTHLSIFILMAIEFIVIASLNSLISFKPLTLALSGVGMAIPIVLALFFFLSNPNKRARTEYNFMQSLIYRVIVFLIIIAVDVIVCLVSPSLLIGFDDPRLYLPWLFAANLPLYAVIYNIFYRTKKFHLTCPKA